MQGKLMSKIGAGAALGFIAAVLVWLLANIIFPGLFYSFEARTYDSRVTSRISDVRSQSIEDIVIIDIDGRSISELGKFQQWPLTYYPRVISFLDSCGVAAIGLDIIFDKDIREPESNQQFVEAVRKAGNVFNSIYFEDEDSLSWRYRMALEPAGFEWSRFSYIFPEAVSEQFRQEARFGNEFVDLLNASRAVGHVNIQGDVDGVVRKINLFRNFNNHSYPALPFKIYLDLMGIDSIKMELGKWMSLYSSGTLLKKIPIDQQGNMVITYAGLFKTYRYIPFYDVLGDAQGPRVPKEYFKDKICLIGTSLPGLFDLRNAPFNPAFPGVEVNANILNTLLTGKFVSQPSALESFMLIAGVGILIGIIAVFLSPLWSIVLVIVLGIIYTFFCYYMFNEHLSWLPIVNPILTLLLTFSAVYLYRYITEERGKKFIKETFSHFVTKSVVDELLANPEKIKLGGEKKECTVFFSDVVGFTTIAEQLTPEALVRLLNEYLTEMTNIVFKYNGMLDKYEGDAIMAVFGAPLPHGNHAFNACATALEMQEQLFKLRELWGKQGRPQLHARCGINSGPMVVGNMGADVRFDYTVMGDSVNLGARLEPANKLYNTKIMIGENTYLLAKDLIAARELDLIRVIGKTEPVRVYELMGLAEKGISDKTKQVIGLFKLGFENYLSQNWEMAIKYFRDVLRLEPLDGPAKHYVRRCESYAAEPPGSDWDGVHTMQTK
jgi:adenylate cyclase